MRQLLNTLFVLSADNYLSLDGENVVVSCDKQERARFALHTLEGIICFTYAGASPALMGTCAQRGIDLCFFSPTGKFLARTVGAERGNVLLRQTQYRIADDPWQSCHFARGFVLGKVYGRYTIHRRSFQGRQESRPSVLRISARRARPRNKTYMVRQGPRKRTYRHYGLCHSARPHNRACAYFCTRTAAILAGVGVFGDGRLYHDQGGPPHYKLSRLLLTHGQRRNQCEIAHRRSIAGRE